MNVAKFVGKRRRGFGFLILLTAVLAILFGKSFLPDYVQFSNDGPLGQQAAAANSFPQVITGAWNDLNSIGLNGGAYPPDITSAIHIVLGPVGFSKFFVPLALLIIGLSAWFFFIELGFSQAAAILGGLAATFTSQWFSSACWGVGSQEVAVGMTFLAMGIAVSIRPNLSRLNQLVRWALAGMAVGINVMEAADIGALYSLLFACFVFYRSIAHSDGSWPLRVIRGVGQTAIVAFFAVLIAAHALSALIATQIKGVAGTEQTPEAKAAHWDFATQWSLPKKETLGLVVPGLFGYGLSTPDGANYWGAGGRDPLWDRYFQSGSQGEAPDSRVHFIRHTGTGNYQGVLVVFVACWAILRCLRRGKSIFGAFERRLIWFWVGTAIVSLLLAFGRHAPFYQMLYQLPYFSTVRNPIKFLNVLTFAAITLFAYGIDGLSRCYLAPALSGGSIGVRWKTWWRNASTFEKRWIKGSIALVIVSVVLWGVYAQMRPKLEHYLQSVQFDETLAHEIAGFSILQVGWFVLFLILSAVFLALIFSGAFAGRRAKTATVLLGLLLVGDLVRSDSHWIIFWNYKEKYEVNTLNSVVQFLSEKPYEHRVAQLPFRAPDQYSLFGQLYGIEWSQQLFPFYNIQSLDIIQMSRTAVDLAAYDEAFYFRNTPPWTRRWELTNTRYLLGPAGFLDVMNQQLDPSKHRFRIVSTFAVVPKPGIEHPLQYADLTAQVAENGPYALFEFTGALPRVKLYSDWRTNSAEEMKNFSTNGMDAVELQVLGEVGTNDFLSLKKLMSPSFDVAQTVLVSAPLPQKAEPATNANPGTVEYESYAPKHIKLKANATASSILLMNDKYDPNWVVRVDGKRADLLRCNFIMRGVFLSPGPHEVEFRFEPPKQMLFVSLATIALGICLIGYVAFSKENRQEQN